MNKTYLILLSTFIACTSMGMGEFEIDEWVVAPFPNKIRRFALSHDGKRFVTSENEQQVSYDEKTRDRIITMTLRVYEQCVDATYREIINKSIQFTAAGGRSLSWLKDNKSIAIVTMAERFYLDDTINYCLYNAKTLEKAGTLDRPFDNDEVRPYFRAHAEDHHDFDSGHSVTCPCGPNRELKFYPDKVCILEKILN